MWQHVVLPGDYNSEEIVVVLVEHMFFSEIREKLVVWKKSRIFSSFMLLSVR